MYQVVFARRIHEELERRNGAVIYDGREAYRSEPVDPSGWLALQNRVREVVGPHGAPQLTTVDPYQAVYLPGESPSIEQVRIPPAADPLTIGSLPELIRELRGFATASELPDDDVHLMALWAEHLEQEEGAGGADLEAYIQLMLSARQASARNLPLWIAAG